VRNKRENAFIKIKRVLHFKIYRNNIFFSRALILLWLRRYTSHLLTYLLNYFSSHTYFTFS